MGMGIRPLLDPVMVKHHHIHAEHARGLEGCAPATRRNPP